MRSEGNISLKNPVTPPGIDPRTVRLVAQRLKHYATPGPRRTYIYNIKTDLNEILSEVQKWTKPASLITVTPFFDDE